MSPAQHCQRNQESLHEAASAREAESLEHSRQEFLCPPVCRLSAEVRVGPLRSKHTKPPTARFCLALPVHGWRFSWKDKQPVSDVMGMELFVPSLAVMRLGVQLVVDESASGSSLQPVNGDGLELLRSVPGYVMVNTARQGEWRGNHYSCRRYQCRCPRCGNRHHWMRYSPGLRQPRPVDRPTSSRCGHRR